MARYTEEFVIPYYDCSGDRFVRPESLLEYMGEASLLHGDTLGVGGADLFKMGFAWMLNRWKVRFIEYPKSRTTITVETWSSGVDRFYATREFNIYDSDRKLLVQASTQWVFCHILKRKPARVPDIISAVYDSEDEHNFYHFHDFKDEVQADEAIEFRVRKSDIDFNHHVNNVKYLNWMLEVLPKQFEDQYLYELDIQYKKEIKQGSLIKSEVSMDIEGEETVCYHKITSNSVLHAFGRSVWKNRK
ncbi:acyl-[acyl-carrier-protein] thioesterase [Alkaliphilus oremlandii]|uniref:Acyl-ACP thioesterase n=1 Tax=Alkaliphilus oremlandii (strain OhILAs) TaxID=350688 RepID=A8MEW2_ALKOO|nr:acyl-ACP thioesterase domain-containing protein [Alkaliphilus oremlandii]ABW18441.1 acyl-ACP thioesterase [Alkaliphilus oremlandii OhILAs]